MSKATLSPDEAAAHMYPSDLKKFEFGEHVADAFSIAVGCPYEVSAPLFTTAQAEAYAAARVREALELAEAGITDLMSKQTSVRAADAIAAIRALIPE